MVHAGTVKTLYVRDRESSQTSTVQARMVVNAAGLHAQTVACSLQGLPQNTIPKAFLARGHYCTMEGGCTAVLYAAASDNPVSFEAINCNL